MGFDGLGIEQNLTARQDLLRHNDPGKSHEILLDELISNIRIAYKPLGTD